MLNVYYYPFFLSGNQKKLDFVRRNDCAEALDYFKIQRNIPYPLLPSI